MRMIDGSLGSFVIEMLSKPSLQRRLTESMIERALSRDVNEDEYILLEEGKWIKMSNLLRYRYIQRAINKVNKSIMTREINWEGRFDFQYGSNNKTKFSTPAAKPKEVNIGLIVACNFKDSGSFADQSLHVLYGNLICQRKLVLRTLN